MTSVVSADPGAAGPAAGQGQLTVKESAVVKTAAFVAEHLDYVSATHRVGFPGFTGVRKRPKVEVDLSGGVAGITVHLALPYPAPLREITEDARERMSSEVHRLTGISVQWVDIRITALQVGTTERRLV